MTRYPRYVAEADRSVPVAKQQLVDFCGGDVARAQRIWEAHRPSTDPVSDADWVRLLDAAARQGWDR